VQARRAPGQGSAEAEAGHGVARLVGGQQHGRGRQWLGSRTARWQAALARDARAARVAGGAVDAVRARTRPAWQSAGNASSVPGQR